MDAFFEMAREEILSPHIIKNKDYVFKTHFHSNLEILLVNKGECPITCNGRNYLIKDGQIAFFDSFVFHGYDNNPTKNVDTRLMVIPLSYAENFLAYKNGLSISNFLIDDAKLCNKLIQVIDDFIYEQKNQTVLSAGIQLFLALLSEKLEFKKSDISSEHNLIKDLLYYVNLNFKNDVSLSTVANHFGYTEAHVSRTFSRFLNQSLKEYVNNLRIRFIQEKIKQGSDLSITELIFQAGFNSQQTYYRNLAKFNNQKK